MATIDTLEVQIKANSQSANKSLDALINKLNVLQGALGGLQTSSLVDLANGVTSLSTSMANFKASGVNKADFNRVASGLSAFSTINPAVLSSVASSVSQLGASFTTLSTVAQSSGHITDLIKTLRSLGSVQVSRATAQIPLLTDALVNMFKELNKAPRVKKSIIEMTNALANLSANGSKVGTSARSMSKGFKTYSTSVKEARKHTLSLAAAFGKFYATYFLVIRGIKALWQGVQGAMDYVETFNYFNTTMDKVGQEYNKKYYNFGEEGAKSFEEGYFANIKTLNEKMTGYTLGASGELVSNNMKNLGMDANQLMNFQARLGAVTNSMGLLGSTTSNTAEAFSMLSADMSSFTNTDLTDIMNDLNSGLLGMSRSLYKYGIDITNTKLQEYALANGIEKKVSAMTQSEKAQLRIIAILDQSKIAWGDQAKTMNTTANQYRMLQQGVKNLGRILGNLLLPVVKMALPVVNGLVMALSDLFEILGFKVWGDNWLSDLMEDANGGYKATDDLADAFDDVDSGINDANTDAKKLKKTLQGFDELNVLSTKDNDTSNALGVSFDLSSQIEDALAEYRSKWDEAFKELDSSANNWKEKISQKLGRIKVLFEDVETGDFKKLGEDLSNIVIDLNNAFANAIDNVDWKKIGEKIGDFFKGIKWVEVLKSVGNFFYELLKAAVELWAGAFESSPIATLIGTTLFIAFKKGKIFKGLDMGSALGTGLSGALGDGSTLWPLLESTANFNLIGTLIATAIAGAAGFEFGKIIGEKLFPKDAEWYKNFHWFGENGFFESLSWAFEQEIKKAKSEVDAFFTYLTGKTMGNEIANMFYDSGLDSEWASGKRVNASKLFGDNNLHHASTPDVESIRDVYSNEDVTDAINETGNETNRLLAEILLATQSSDRTNDINAIFDGVRTKALEYESRKGRPAFSK